MLKTVILICYRNGKDIDGRKDVSYEGSPATAMVIRSRAIFDEFINKLYHVTMYKK